MRKYKILLFMVLLYHCSCSGQKSKKFDYLLNDNLSGNKEKPFLGMEQEFSTVRTYFYANEFKETRLFTGSVNDDIHYKVEQGIWYYKKNDKWQLLADLKNNKGGTIRLNNKNYKITIYNTIKINGATLYKVRLEQPNITQSHNSTYYFDLNAGVVIIKNSNGSVLLRRDFFSKNLSEDQLDSL